MLTDEIETYLTDATNFFKWYNLGHYSDQPIELLDRSQVREAISYYVNDQKLQLLDEISNAVQHYTLFSWKSQDIVTEARIVLRLRNIGYDVALVDKFPTDSIELHKICSKLNFSTVTNNKINFIKSQLRSIKLPWYFILVCLGLILYFDIQLLFWSLVFTWAVWAVTELPKHDYIEHRYIVPKNKTIKYAVDFVLYLLNPAIYADRKSWQAMHDNHHKNWRSEKDYLTYAIDRGIIRAMVDHKPLLKPDADSLGHLLKDYKEFPWLFKNLLEIKLALGLFLLLWLGPQLFLYFVLIPLGLKLGFEGQHDWFIIRFGERNYWFLWPLALNQAWHLQHHQTYNRAPKSWSDIFQGPLWVRYINPQYYFARLLFKINLLG